MLRIRFNTIAALLCCGLTAATLRADNAELKRKLAAIDMQRDGLNTPAEKLEREALALLPQHSSPEDRGAIYVQIAMVYAQNGLTTPDKTIEYCRKALDSPLDVITRCRMFVHWADGLQTKHRADQGERLASARREIAVVCLRGLRVILDQKPPANAQELPVVNRFDVPAIPGDPTYESFVKKNKEEMEAREKVMLQNDLVLYRDILIDKCASLLIEGPPNVVNEFKNWSRDVLKVERDVQDVQQRVEDRRKTASTWTETRPRDNPTSRNESGASRDKPTP